MSLVSVKAAAKIRSGANDTQVRIRARASAGPQRYLLPLVILSDAEGAYATEAESKDPENVSSAMPIQGVLL